MKKKQEFDELDFYESSLREILGDDEDALQVVMEDMVIPHMQLTLVNIGSTGFPQVGDAEYWEKQKFEKEFLMKKIPELAGDPPPNTQLKWKGFEHDFGTYHEMCLLMDERNTKHWEYHGKCECLDFDALEAELRFLWMQTHSPIPVEDIDHLINPDKL